MYRISMYLGNKFIEKYSPSVRVGGGGGGEEKFMVFCAHFH